MSTKKDTSLKEILPHASEDTIGLPSKLMNSSPKYQKNSKTQNKLTDASTPTAKKNLMKTDSQNSLNSYSEPGSRNQISRIFGTILQQVETQFLLLNLSRGSIMIGKMKIKQSTASTQEMTGNMKIFQSLRGLKLEITNMLIMKHRVSKFRSEKL